MRREVAFLSPQIKYRGLFGIARNTYYDWWTCTSRWKYWNNSRQRYTSSRSVNDMCLTRTVAETTPAATNLLRRNKLQQVPRPATSQRLYRFNSVATSTAPAINRGECYITSCSNIRSNFSKAHISSSNFWNCTSTTPRGYWGQFFWRKIAQHVVFSTPTFATESIY